MALLAWIILWLPFFAAAFIFFFLQWKPRFAGALATTLMFTAFGLSAFLVFHSLQYGIGEVVVESSITWIQLGPTEIEFGVLINGLTMLMLMIVTGVGSLIFLYSTSYMENEEGYSRYFAYLSLFAFSMLGIVLANNLIQVFIFWELVGLSSYLLIGFYYEKESASLAGKKAFLTTRVGDVGMMIGILMLFHQAGIHSFNFYQIAENIRFANITPGVMTIISMLLFMGIAGKSAQVPLHVWLPDAMEGPTPVSALMHAATMVAAGVFLLARLFFIFEASPQALHMIAWIGVVTALIPATIALVQDDIKKVLAYSTLSQLGYMVMAIGLGSPEAGMFHLTTHAFFKALLFLGAGSLIHAMHTQDIWEMSHHSGLFKKMPVTSWTFLIGTLALMGIPPTSGFFSKEEILITASHGPRPLFIMAMAVVFLTAFYMGRVFTAVFFSPKKRHENHHAVHESNWKMALPLAALAVLSLISGFIPVKTMLGIEEITHHHESAAETLKWLSIAVASGGFITACFIFRKKASSQFLKGASLLTRKYFFDDVYDSFIKYVQQNVARACDSFENIAVVRWAVNGSAFTMLRFGKLLNHFQTGMIQFYALIFTLGVTFMIYVFILVR